MIVNTLDLWTGGGAVGNISNVDINKLRLLIAEYLQVHIRHVTDDAHLGRDLGADWLDRLELIMLVEDIAGVEITDNEVDQIERVGDLIHYIDQTNAVHRLRHAAVLAHSNGPRRGCTMAMLAASDVKAADSERVGRRRIEITRVKITNGV